MIFINKVDELEITIIVGTANLFLQRVLKDGFAYWYCVEGVNYWNEIFKIFQKQILYDYNEFEISRR